MALRKVKHSEFWSNSLSELEHKLQTSPKKGLTSQDAESRLLFYGKNSVKKHKKSHNLLSLWVSQFKSPIIIIFIFTSVLSFFLGQPEDALLIIVIVIVSGFLGFWQERGALYAIYKLQDLVQSKTTVIRDGSNVITPSEKIVPGDIIILKSGDNIPADSIVIESRDLFVNEATLTGESYPVEKISGVLHKDIPLKERSNSVFMGTFVVSGTAKVMVVKTGFHTELGRISNKLKHKNPETDFEHGVRKFGYFLMEITLILVISILIINVYFERPVLESFLFSLALAIGLAPQLLPAIISVNLAHGAKRMANEKVIVKRLAAIENLGSMNILCSDKTGTLTVGEVKLKSAIDVGGNEDNKVLLYSYLNSKFETGFTNPIDKAIRDFCTDKFDLKDYQKVDEIPYDFIRKRLTILVSITNNHSDIKLTCSHHPNRTTTFVMITKGALYNILDSCSKAEIYGKIVDISKVKQDILRRYEELGKQGFRVLGLCYKNIIDDNKMLEAPNIRIDKKDETQMTLLGFLVFFDPIKPDLLESISSLRKLGISVKIISGDNKYVVSSLGKQIGMPINTTASTDFDTAILTGPELHSMRPDALVTKVKYVDVFAEIEPNQKEQIILALRKSEGNVVGYIGDGINDASAIHAADVGISVDNAPDVTKEASDFVLLEKDLGVLADGVSEGRRTFANTMKYVFMATSANFGNMFSMAGASIFLSFLPLLPKQILLMNLLTDIPEMAISTDKVDKEIIEKPRRWNIKFIRKFMLVFGLLSAVFDFITFGILIFILNPSTTEQFRTTWFIESIISACLIVLIVRTSRPIFKSKPSKYLILSTLAMIIIVTILPFTAVGKIFGLSEIPIFYIGIVGLIVLTYLISAEGIKRIYYKLVDQEGF